MESELFGYEEGAFTGAMPLHMQAKLLRVLEEKEGGYYPIPVDIRIIEALNKDLKKLANQKKFREVLYYRLNVINIRIPPLRERKEDIMVFSNYFLDELNRKNKAKVIINKKAQELLMNHKWDGNIRELKNVIESAYVLAENNCIGIKNLPSNLLAYYVDEGSNVNKGLLNNILNEFKKDIIIEIFIFSRYLISKNHRLGSI